MIFKENVKGNLVVELVSINDNPEFEMRQRQPLSAMMEAIKSHLEFLGYEVTYERYSATQRATHPFMRDFTFYEREGVVRLMELNYAKRLDKPSREKYLEFVNKANEVAWVAHFTVNEELDIVAHTSYVGPYYKSLLGRLLEKWNSDLTALFDWNDSSEFLQTVRTTSQVRY